MLGHAGPAASQVLNVYPKCGISGTTNVQISGSGWAEPDPICEYLFFFDGAEVAPRQPDGLYGPPASTFQVPGGKAPGNYIVKVELRLTDNGQLIQCRQDTFKVVTNVPDPFTVTRSGGNSQICVDFDPSGVCDVGDCDKIYFVQTRKVTGTKSTGGTRRLTYVEQGWANAAGIDADFTAAGIGIDRIWGSTVPYYGQPAGSSTVGKTGPPPVKATMWDQPQRPDSSYPTAPDMITSMRIDFEINVFCGGGPAQGRWLGRMTWDWTRAKGAASGFGTITNTAPNRGQPTQSLLDALSLWNTNHGFNLPVQRPPTRGGQPCS